jgi:hypothetical protein
MKTSSWNHFNLDQEVSSVKILDENNYCCNTLNTAAVTVNISLCMSDVSVSHLPKPTCIEAPPLTIRETLVLALPFLPTNSSNGLEEDLLCPVHPLPDERCVDLLSCNRFRGSAYANSITICRIRNNGSVLEMCFHNVTDIMNGTRLHFFYSDLHCHPDGAWYQSSRTYVKSIQLLISQKGRKSLVYTEYNFIGTMISCRDTMHSHINPVTFIFL